MITLLLFFEQKQQRIQHSLIFISDLLVSMDMPKNVMFVIVVVKIGRWTHSISATWMYVILQHSICLSSLSLDY